MAHYPLYHDNYAHVKFTVAKYNRLGRDLFTRNTVFDLELGIKVTWNVAQYPLHYVIYIQLQSLNLLRLMVKEEMHLQEIHNLTFNLTFGLRSHEMLPSILCDLHNCKV